MPAEGEWTLGVLDTVVDGSNGTVTSWSLDVEMRPCDWKSALRLVVVLLQMIFLPEFPHQSLTALLFEQGQPSKGVQEKSWTE